MLHRSVEFFAKFIEKETGIVYSEHNYYQLKMRLDELCLEEKISSLDELLFRFERGEEGYLRRVLLDVATNNETLFFRDPKFFDAMKEFILNEISKNNPKEIKVWSAAASTGQEALSVAILLDELFLRGDIPQYSITATDISERAISKCKSGLYTDFEVSRGLSIERRNKYFENRGEMWKVKNNLTDHIKFGFNNLIKSSIFETFHLILCRNVLIYQKVEQKKVVLSNLFHQLEPRGAILLGAGETMIGLNDNVYSDIFGEISFYRKKESLFKQTA